ncbi:Phosphoserine phosphatase RsbU [Roseimaritima ulvae]|uniref:Phosphoserine phosphatase RsbU n=2 Tax=Roseimaritima ulvae TaxID=980254 RepID=A0A5B9QVU0_9BACT|nr:Phosphoserine phosphatase RsbU [Roseimaritima ulvae]
MQMQCMEVWGGNRPIDRNIETPGLHVWAFCKPHGKSLSGGDVYYLSSCASGRITRLLLADVSGHGEVVSAVATGLRDLMRRNINHIRQTKFVRAMNEQFSQLSTRGEFATAVVSTFFSPTMKLNVCNAGHPPSLLYRQQQQTWQELTTEMEGSDQIADTPLGVSDEAAYSQHEVQLDPGDLVLNFSDAIMESEDADGQQIGRAGVLKLVSELDVSQPDKIVPTILEKVSQLHSENLDRDDVTILLIQATGEGPSLRNNLMAPFRLLGSVRQSAAGTTDERHTESS